MDRAVVCDVCGETNRATSGDAPTAGPVCAGTIADAGLGVTMDHRTAYSIGIGFAPDWGEGQIISINQGEHRPLQTGMTFTSSRSSIFPD